MNFITSNTTLSWFSRIEGLSLLLLLFVAMPIKYIGGNPQPVKVVGMLHGLLFMALTVLIFVHYVERSWSKRMLFFALLTATIPFGFLMLDRRLK